jgi:hypothetical protein
VADSNDGLNEIMIGSIPKGTNFLDLSSFPFVPTDGIRYTGQGYIILYANNKYGRAESGVSSDLITFWTDVGKEGWYLTNSVHPNCAAMCSSYSLACYDDSISLIDSEEEIVAVANSMGLSCQVVEASTATGSTSSAPSITFSSWINTSGQCLFQDATSGMHCSEDHTTPSSGISRNFCYCQPVPTPSPTSSPVGWYLTNSQRKSCTAMCHEQGLACSNDSSVIDSGAKIASAAENMGVACNSTQGPQSGSDSPSIFFPSMYTTAGQCYFKEAAAGMHCDAEHNTIGEGIHRKLCLCLPNYLNVGDQVVALYQGQGTAYYDSAIVQSISSDGRVVLMWGSTSETTVVDIANVRKNSLAALLAPTPATVITQYSQIFYDRVRVATDGAKCGHATYGDNAYGACAYNDKFLLCTSLSQEEQAGIDTFSAIDGCELSNMTTVQDCADMVAQESGCSELFTAVWTAGDLLKECSCLPTGSDTDISTEAWLCGNGTFSCGIFQTPPECQGDRSTWNAGRGDCTTYAPGWVNHQLFCSQDTDEGYTANDACEECGACQMTNWTNETDDADVTTTTDFPWGFPDPMRIPGDYMFGRPASGAAAAIYVGVGILFLLVVIGGAKYCRQCMVKMPHHKRIVADIGTKASQASHILGDAFGISHSVSSDVRPSEVDEWAVPDDDVEAQPDNKESVGGAGKVMLLRGAFLGDADDLELEEDEMEEIMSREEEILSPGGSDHFDIALIGGVSGNVSEKDESDDDIERAELEAEDERDKADPFEYPDDMDDAIMEERISIHDDIDIDALGSFDVDEAARGNIESFDADEYARDHLESFNIDDFTGALDDFTMDVDIAARAESRVDSWALPDDGDSVHTWGEMPGRVNMQLTSIETESSGGKPSERTVLGEHDDAGVMLGEHDKRRFEGYAPQDWELDVDEDEPIARQADFSRESSSSSSTLTSETIAESEGSRGATSMYRIPEEDAMSPPSTGAGSGRLSSEAPDGRFLPPPRVDSSRDDHESSLPLFSAGSDGPSSSRSNDMPGSATRPTGATTTPTPPSSGSRDRGSTGTQDLGSARMGPQWFSPGRQSDRGPGAPAEEEAPPDDDDIPRFE